MTRISERQSLTREEKFVALVHLYVELRLPFDAALDAAEADLLHEQNKDPKETARRIIRYRTSKRVTLFGVNQLHLNALRKKLSNPTESDLLRTPRSAAYTGFLPCLASSRGTFHLYPRPLRALGLPAFFRGAALLRFKILSKMRAAQTLQEPARGERGGEDCASKDVRASGRRDNFSVFLTAAGNRTEPGSLPKPVALRYSSRSSSSLWRTGKGTRQIRVKLYACIFGAAWQIAMYAGS